MTDRKRPIHRTRILVDGRVVFVEFYPDRVEARRSDSETWDDITAEAHRIAGLVALGKPVSGDGPEHLAALVLRGIEMLLHRPAIDDADHVSLRGWEAIYVRFETNKVVEATMREMRGRMRRERKPAPLPPGQYVTSAENVGVTDAGIPFLRDASKVRPDGAV